MHDKDDERQSGNDPQNPGTSASPWGVPWFRSDLGLLRVSDGSVTYSFATPATATVAVYTVGTGVQVSSPSNALISTSTFYGFARSYTPRIGDTVLMNYIEGSWYVVDALGTYPKMQKATLLTNIQNTVTGYTVPSQMQILVEAGKSYVLNWHLNTTSDTTNDWNYQFTYPSGNFDWQSVHPNVAATDKTAIMPDMGAYRDDTTTASSALTVGGGGADLAVRGAGTYTSLGTGGTLQLQFRSATSTANAAWLLEGSHIIAWEI